MKFFQIAIMPDHSYFTLHFYKNMRKEKIYVQTSIIKQIKMEIILPIKSGESKFKCTFRTGELYLNSAEAAAHLNKLPEARTRLLKLIENRYTSEGYEQKKNEINAMKPRKS